ncbi:hypothetical protein CHS0354_042800 [Potamilus streckersoni]|uniref:DRBM domain-containing protein n=1 Tax=Potamilus streckersoni TaxID=2493646 RepID=A0AAE0T5L6_9BIVA|nr:hypothetical protein CHS0354_042800 [Potamilus streckersoni]
MDHKKSMDYRKKMILAPMVRICTLPMRQLALEYGADIVFCEEIIDFKILSAKRIENDLLGTIDYVLSDETIVFRTHPKERDKLVFQLGTSDPKRAVAAAKKVEKDISAIDVNMGCPKLFSLKGGMGAALLSEPEKAKEILSALVNCLSIPVTCKIRILPTLQETLDFVKLMESTGISAITIHGRTKEERPQHQNHNDVIKAAAEVLKIPVIANGGSKEISEYADIERFRNETGASSVMIARAAQWNPSILRKEGKLPLFEVIRRYLQICIDHDNMFTNTKYCILQMMHADMDKEEGIRTQTAAAMGQLCEIWNMKGYYEAVSTKRQILKEEMDRKMNSTFGIKKRKLENGRMLIEMPTRFFRKDYPASISPKLKLYEWTHRNKVNVPEYKTVERPEDHCYNSTVTVEGKSYTSCYWEKSKRLAEQAAAITCLIVLGEHDGKKEGCSNINDDIARIWRDGDV